MVASVGGCAAGSAGMSAVAEGGSPVMLVGADGCAGESAVVSEFRESNATALVGGLGGCVGSRRGGRRLPTAALWRWFWLRAGALEAGWGCRRWARYGRRYWGRAWAVRGGLRSCVSVGKTLFGGVIDRCGRVRGGLGRDVGGWQGRLGGLRGPCGRVPYGLG